MKYCVDEALESLSSVSQTEWHTEEFKLTKWSDDSGFGYVFRSNWNLVVGPNKVDSFKILLCRGEKKHIPECAVMGNDQEPLLSLGLGNLHLDASLTKVSTQDGEGMPRHFAPTAL